MTGSAFSFLQASSQTADNAFNSQSFGVRQNKLTAGWCDAADDAFNSLQVGVRQLMVSRSLQVSIRQLMMPSAD